MADLDPLAPFGPVWGASGVENFFGVDEGYPFHKWFGMIPGFDFRGMTFVAKSTTVEPRAGNMPLDGNLMPVEWKPPCIRVNFSKAAVLNAVGLSGPGAEALFAADKWQKRTQPFFLSFAPQGATPEDRCWDGMRFAEIARRHIPQFHALVGLQFNITCPNTGDDVTDAERLAEEAIIMLAELRLIGIPIVVKVNVLMPPYIAIRIAKHPACAGITVSNAVPWAALPWLNIDRKKLFGSDESPLAEFGGGGLSGAPILPHVIRWVKNARTIGIWKHINAGGGIMRSRDVFRLRNAGASSVSLGSIAIVRPWRVQKTILAAKQAWYERC